MLLENKYPVGVYVQHDISCWGATDTAIHVILITRTFKVSTTTADIILLSTNIDKLKEYIGHATPWAIESGDTLVHIA